MKQKRAVTAEKRLVLEKYLVNNGYKILFDRVCSDLRRCLPEQGFRERPGSTGVGFLLSEKTYFGVYAGYLGTELYSVSILPQAITWGGDEAFARLRRSVDLEEWQHGGNDERQCRSRVLSFQTLEEWDEIRPQVLEFVHAVLANRTNVKGPED